MIIKMFHKTKRKKEKKKLFQIFICSIHKIVLIKKKKTFKAEKCPSSFIICFEF